MRAANRLALEGSQSEAPQDQDDFGPVFSQHLTGQCCWVFMFWFLVMLALRSYLRAAGLLNPSVKVCLTEGSTDGKLGKEQETKKVFLYGEG